MLVEEDEQMDDNESVEKGSPDNEENGQGENFQESSSNVGS
jgi:hypothetical protein